MWLARRGGVERGVAEWRFWEAVLSDGLGGVCMAGLWLDCTSPDLWSVVMATSSTIFNLYQNQRLAYCTD